MLSTFIINPDTPLTYSVADPGGEVWGNCTPKRLWRPVKIAPLFAA